MAISSNARTRVPGHGYTLWTWGNVPIGFCTNVQHQSPSPLAQAVEIQPLDYVRPAEVITGRAITGGQLSFTVVQLYGHEMWDHLGGSFGENIHDLADVFHKVQRDLTEFSPNPINLIRVIRPPGTTTVQLEQYFGVRITDIREDETTATDTLMNTLAMTVRYAYKKKVGNPDRNGFAGDPVLLPSGSQSIV